MKKLILSLMFVFSGCSSAALSTSLGEGSAEGVITASASSVSSLALTGSSFSVARINN